MIIIDIIAIAMSVRDRIRNKINIFAKIFARSDTNEFVFMFTF